MAVSLPDECRATSQIREERTETLRIRYGRNGARVSVSRSRRCSAPCRRSETDSRQKCSHRESRPVPILPVGRQTGQANHRDIVQCALGVDLLCDLIDFEVLRFGVDQDQVGLKMNRGLKRFPAIALLVNEILPGRPQRRADYRRQARLVID